MGCTRKVYPPEVCLQSLSRCGVGGDGGGAPLDLRARPSACLRACQWGRTVRHSRTLARGPGSHPHGPSRAAAAARHLSSHRRRRSARRHCRRHSAVVRRRYEGCIYLGGHRTPHLALTPPITPYSLPSTYPPLGPPLGPPLPPVSCPLPPPVPPPLPGVASRSLSSALVESASSSRGWRSCQVRIKHRGRKSGVREGYTHRVYS